MSNWRLRARFWGVRGSIATPEVSNLGYGGNTSCMEIVTPDGRSIVFDAGTGLRNLGGNLMAAGANRQLDLSLFLTHFHWDHIAGIPFFGPLYAADQKITFHAPGHWGPLPPILHGQMSTPYFPVNFDLASARKEFVRSDEEPTKVDGVTVHPFPLNHPQGAVGYRIEREGAVIVYATDLEHGHEQLDRTLRDFAAGADVLICDSQFTPEDYPRFRGWGHSTWLNAIEVARDAGVGRVILFHHDPSRTDTMLDGILAEARQHFGAMDAAREGDIVEL